MVLKSREIYRGLSVRRKAFAAAADAQSPGVKVESLDALYQKAKNEGRVVIYAASSTNTEEIVFPAFEKRFPGITVNHVNATADKLVARAIAEARGGKILADVVSGTMNYINQLKEQNLLADLALPEAVAYPPALRGPYWVATDTEYFIAAWNTSRVKNSEAPKSFDDFSDPKWAGIAVAESLRCPRHRVPAQCTGNRPLLPPALAVGRRSATRSDPARRRMNPLERFAAWILTGPVGRFVLSAG